MDVEMRAAAAGVAPARRELSWYEGVRAGSGADFTALASTLDPVLRDLAGAPADRTRALLGHTWEMALSGLDVFAWRCSLRAWVAGILIGFGAAPAATGAGVAAGPHAPPAVPHPSRPGRSPGPADWADLPWGPRWSGAAWDELSDALRRLPPAQRRGVLLRDVYRWGERDTCDALGLTAVRARSVLRTAVKALHDVLARVSGDTATPSPVLLEARLRRLRDMLAVTAAPPPAALDPALYAVFLHWRAGRRRGALAWLDRRRADRRQARDTKSRAAIITPL